VPEHIPAVAVVSALAPSPVSKSASSPSAPLPPFSFQAIPSQHAHAPSCVRSSCFFFHHHLLSFICFDVPSSLAVFVLSLARCSTPRSLTPSNEKGAHLPDSKHRHPDLLSVHPAPSNANRFESVLRRDLVDRVRPVRATDRSPTATHLAHLVTARPVP